MPYIGLTYSPADIVNEGGTIVFRSSNIQNGEIDYSDIVQVNKKIKDSIITRKDDLLICARNGSPRLIGKNALLKESDAGQTFGAFMLVFRSKDNHFVHQLLCTKGYNSQVSENLGARINQITTSNIRDFEFYFPQSTAERNKIAGFLDLIDERISIQNKVIEHYQSLIRAITRTCFHNDNEHSKILLSEIAPNIVSGKSKPSAGKYPLYGSTGIIGTCSSSTYKGEMILVARVGSIGQIQLINTEGCGITDNTLIIDSGELNRYVYFFLKSFDFQKITSGTTQPLITGGSLKRISVPILPTSKRVLFTSLLSAIEQRIKLEQESLQFYLQSKAYVLTNMFI